MLHQDFWLDNQTRAKKKKKKYDIIISQNTYSLEREKKK